jgi:hypothetical protein
MGIAASNRCCRILGLVILFTAVAISHLHLPIFGDFVQFHMAGLVDREHAWGDALYPVPIPGSIHNAGNVVDSVAKPRADAIAAAHGVDSVPYHFILPPPAALLCWPLGYFDIQTAHRLWLLASVLAAGVTAMCGGLILERCAGRQTRWAGALTLLIVIMPPMQRAVLMSNLTPFISASIGLAVLSLMGDDGDLPGAAGIVIGIVLKYAGAMLMPIALVQRRWRMIAWTIAFTCLWTALTVLLMGPGPFIEFATVIAPTLGRSHELADNVSICGIWLHASHRLPPLPDSMTVALSVLRPAVLAAILLPMIRLHRHRMRQPAAVCAAAMALLAWLLIFSPIAWSHYLIYLTPLWGWLACPIDRPRWQQVASWIAMGLVILSPDQMTGPAIDPWGIHLLASLVIMLCIGVTELYALTPERFATPGLLNDSRRLVAMVRKHSHGQLTSH